MEILLIRKLLAVSLAVNLLPTNIIFRMIPLKEWSYGLLPKPAIMPAPIFIIIKIRLKLKAQKYISLLYFSLDLEPI
ncbi:MAG: hypothetical protein WBI62_09345 [Sedimentibacter sp.]